MSATRLDLVTAYLDLLEASLTGVLLGDAPIDSWSGGIYDPKLRGLGLDWPGLAQTMIGTARMRNVRQACEHAIVEGVPGDFVETGVWRGGACIYMRGILAAHGEPDRRVFAADSFAGLPKPSPFVPADEGDRHHAQGALAVSRREVEANFAKYGLLDDRVVFLEGWFSDTLRDAPIERIAVLRLDGDMYGSTMEALEALYPKVSKGGTVIVDDFNLAPARAAVIEYRARMNIEARFEAIDRFGGLVACMTTIPSMADIAKAMAIAHKKTPPVPIPIDRLERAKQCKVIFATPIARDPTVQYLVSLLKTFGMFSKYEIEHCAEFITGSSNLPRARNALVARFLASKCSHLLMIDDDMGWDHADAMRLLASDKPFIGAAGRKKNERPNIDSEAWCAQFLVGEERLQPDEMGAIRVARVGGAFVKIERSVFDALIAAHPEWKSCGLNDMSDEQRAAYHQFFRFDTESSEEIGEDYLFCDRWRAIGGDVWVDPSIELTHVGARPYSGRLLEILQLSTE